MKRKPKKMEDVTHGPFTAAIRFDQENGIFSCEYGDGRFQDATIEAVRRWAKERLRALATLKWNPILEVCFDAEDERVNNLENCTNLSLRIERHYIAWDGAKWVITPWVVMARGVVCFIGPARSEMEQTGHHALGEQELMEQRIASAKPFWAAQGVGEVMQFPLVKKGGIRGEVDYYVPYTEDRWATMLGIIDRMRELRASVHKMLSTATGWQQLAIIAATKMLADAKPNEESK